MLDGTYIKMRQKNMYFITVNEYFNILLHRPLFYAKLTNEINEITISKGDITNRSTR
jgi:hypothetical protein